MNNVEFDKTLKYVHTPVLLKEILEKIKLKPNGIYVDATVGGAGHSLEIAKQLREGELFAFDKDPDAIFVARERLKKYNAKVFCSDFSNLKEILNKELNEKKVDAVLMDLGVSSFQLDNPNRGFSYKKDGPLDMRMSKSGKTAKDILKNSSEEELAQILKNFGEEKFAKKIAKTIVEKRDVIAIETTKDFAEIIKNCLPFKFKRKKNPCKKSFQAVRIAVNNEFSSLEKGLKAAFSILNPGGRLLVVSFHSLEDKIVKNFFKEKSTGCICPDEFPICVCGNHPKAKIITKKPIIPTEQEIEKNNRSHCAKLRVLEKI